MVSVALIKQLFVNNLIAKLIVRYCSTWTQIQDNENQIHIKRFNVNSH